MVPSTVFDEVVAHSDEASRALASTSSLKKAPAVGVSPTIASWDLGSGESSVLSWAAAHPGTVAILDDYAARTCAETLGIPVVGTLGLALRAKLERRVSKAQPLVEKLIRAGLYLSDALVRQALELVDE